MMALACTETSEMASVVRVFTPLMAWPREDRGGMPSGQRRGGPGDPIGEGRAIPPAHGANLSTGTSGDAVVEIQRMCLFYPHGEERGHNSRQLRAQTVAETRPPVHTPRRR